MVPGAVSGLAALVVGLVTLVRKRWVLVTSVLGSLNALLLVSGGLLAAPGVNPVDALKTGGLAGAAVLALHGLWINDRRRRTEEARQEVERGRAEHDRERISDERFAKAVEMLGNDADQVRVGALHVLVGLSRGRPAYTQTVLDVLCAHLRRPHRHPSHETNPADPHRVEVHPFDAGWTEEHGTADRERQVRLTAQRRIAELLPGAAETTRYDLDLTGAAQPVSEHPHRRRDRARQVAHRRRSRQGGGGPPSPPAGHRRRHPPRCRRRPRHARFERCRHSAGVATPDGVFARGSARPGPAATTAPDPHWPQR